VNFQLFDQRHSLIGLLSLENSKMQEPPLITAEPCSAVHSAAVASQRIPAFRQIV